MIPDRAAYVRRWSDLHGGYRPAPGSLVDRWLGAVHVLARPLARAGLAPAAVTAASVLTAYAVAAAAWAGGAWTWAAAALAAVSGLGDGLDGAVAILRDRVTRFGYLLDSLADRAADAAYLLAFWLLGAPAELCVGAGAAVVLLEYGRARAGNAGLGEIAVVTVGERPTRVIVTTLFLLTAAVYGGHRALAVTSGAAATLGVAALGAVQFLVAAHRRLR